MELNVKSLENLELWNEKGIKVPHFDHASMVEKTKKDPVWIHFGAGNIFRGFIANLQHELLEKGVAIFFMSDARIGTVTGMDGIVVR